MEESKKQQQHFVLVHGACHGAWCWYKVATRLRSEGHRVTALDMAAAGANPKRVEELSSISDYCQPLMEFMTALPADERVVLVGHSLGGVCISLAMEKFPEKVYVAVFVTALMPGPDLTLLAVLAEHEKQLGSYMDTHISFSNGVDRPPTSLLFGPQFLASRLYQLSPPEDGGCVESGMKAVRKTATLILWGYISIARARLNPPKLCPTRTTFSVAGVAASTSSSGCV